MTKTSNGTNGTTNANGMMPDQKTIIEMAGKMAKGTGAVASALGVSVTTLIPIAMLIACLLPVLLRPITPIFNTLFLVYAVSSILKRIGKVRGDAAKEGSSGFES